MKYNQVIKILRNEGKRITKVREQIVKSVLGSTLPITALQIQKILTQRGLKVNKTTVYRELAFLLREKLILEVRLAANVTHYESATLLHHHHATCKNCGKTQDVITNELEDSMKKLEKRIGRQGFTIKEHNLEFYGLCANCQ